MSFDPGILLAVVLTLAVFTFLVKDNAVFRFAEHLFVGVASGYAFVVAWTYSVRPNLVDRLLDPEISRDERLLLLIPLALGLCMIARLVPKGALPARIASAFVVGYVAGTNIPAQFKAQVLEQVAATVRDRPLTSVSNVVFVLGVVSVLIYFVFSVAKDGPRRRLQLVTGEVGRLFLMVAFGATFGNTVMARVSMLIGRVQFLLRDWLGWVE